MDEEIERFRNRIRLQENSSVIKTTRSAFATEKPSFKGKDQQGKKIKSRHSPCVCGGNMYYADCPYLVPSKAPTGWKEDPIIRKTVNNALKDTKLQARIKKNIETRERIDATSASVTTTPDTPATPITLLTTIYSAVASHSSSIGSYLIHDGGSDAHVCNNPSAHLYTKTREAGSDKYLGSGIGVIKIESWGIMETAFESPTGLIPIRLENVAFVSSFVTSLDSQSILDSKGVHFDTGGPRLYQNGTTKFLLHRNGGHFTFSATGVPHFYPQHATKFSPATLSPTALVSQKLTTRSGNEWQAKVHRLIQNWEHNYYD